MSALKDKLQIFIVTYNRREKLKFTMNSILAANSPVSHCSITVLDNHSTDGTSKIVDKFCATHKNVCHIRNNRNVGGNANIAKAFEMANMEYVWILADDDEYDFINWQEIEDAILANKYDCILAEYKINFNTDNIPYLINTLTFVSAGIYKTKNITETVMQNMETNICFSFPHLALGCHLINIHADFFIPKHPVVKQNFNNCFRRGTDIKELHFRQRQATLFSNYINSYHMIINKHLRHKCDNELWLGKSFFFSMKAFLRENGIFPYNICDVFWGINCWQKAQLCFAIFWVMITYWIPKRFKKILRGGGRK